MEIVPLDLKYDPAKFYLYQLVMVSDFDSVQEIKDFLNLRNAGLVGSLDLVLAEMEKARCIDIIDGKIKRGLLLDKDRYWKVAFNPNNKELYGDVSKILTERAILDNNPERANDREKSGFNFYTFPSNSVVIEKVNRLLLKHREDLIDVLVESADLESSDFLTVIVSSGFLQPEDF